jgi:pimeloyl-ACP methyl ester carboxylesterase
MIMSARPTTGRLGIVSVGPADRLGREMRDGDKRLGSGASMNRELAEELGFAARIRGPGPDAPALLFVHGLGADCTFWDEAWSWAGLAPYSLVAVDLPGFGATPPLRPFTFEVVVERLARLVDALGVPTVCVGHSMGGTLVALLADRQPVLRGAVLVEANLVAVSPETSASAAGAQALADGRFDEWFADFARSAQAQAPPAAGFARYMPSLRRADRETFAAACRELVAAAAGDVGIRYAGLARPRVYVVGSDPEPAHLDFLRRHGLEVEEIADAGHSVMVDQPARFYGFLEAWAASALSR